MKSVQILCWYDCVGQFIGIPVGWWFQHPNKRTTVLPGKFIIDHGKNPGTEPYHHIPSIWCQHPPDIIRDSYQVGSFFAVCFSYFLYFSYVFSLLLHGGTTRNTLHDPQGTWPADFMKLPRGAWSVDQFGFDVSFMWLRHPLLVGGWNYFLVIYTRIFVGMMMDPFWLALIFFSNGLVWTTNMEGNFTKRMQH